MSAISNQSKVSTQTVNSTHDTSIDTKLDQFGQQIDAAITQLVAKEHFVFTDPEGQLYHFSVEGNTIRDGTKVCRIFCFKIIEGYAYTAPRMKKIKKYNYLLDCCRKWIGKSYHIHCMEK